MRVYIILLNGLNTIAMLLLDKIKFLIKNNSNVRVLLENFLSMFSLRILVLIFPLITMPYLIRTIGFSNYGIIMLAASLTSYFVSVTDYSFRITGTRDISVFKGSKVKINYIYSKIMVTRTIFLLVSLIILVLIVNCYEPFFQNREIFYFSFLALIGNCFFPDWFFQGMLKMKFITFIDLGVKFFFTISVFAFIKIEKDAWIYPLLQSIGVIVSALIAQIILLKQFRLSFYKIRARYVWILVKENFPIFINQFMPNLYNNTNTFLLGILAPAFVVGVYSAIKRITDLCVTLVGVFSVVLFPFLNIKKNVFPLYRKGMIWIGLILTIVPILSYKIIFWYLNIDDDNAFSILLILSIGTFFIVMYDIYGLNYFIIKRQDRLVMNNTIIASVFGFILAFPLINYWGILGAAINLTLSRMIMGIGLYWKFKKEEK